MQDDTIAYVAILVTLIILIVLTLWKLHRTPVELKERWLHLRNRWDNIRYKGLPAIMESDENSDDPHEAFV